MTTPYKLISGSADLGQRFALDVQGANALKQAARNSPQEGAKLAARQFEAVFTQMMLKSMRDATPSDGPFDSEQTRTFTSMLDQQLAQQMSSRGIGLADMLLRQLGQSGGQAGVAAGQALSAGRQVPLNGAAYGPADGLGTVAGAPASASEFVSRLAASAQSASQTTGIPARYMLSQAALESGWGKHEIKRADGSTSFNLFGIKAGKNWKGSTVEVTTTEYVDGTPRRVKARFRAYGSYQEAFTDYANLLRGNPRYASVLASGGDERAFAHGLQRAGYATDPQYAAKLLRIMKQIT